MRSEINAAIDKMQQRLDEVLGEVLELKKAINVMRKTIGEEPLYEEVEEEVKADTGVLRPDQYFGMPLATAVKEVLRTKKRATKLQDIIEQLEMGGFEFPSNWKDKKDYVRLMGVSLGKNRTDFVPVNTNEGTLYGLWEFYPNKQKAKERKKVSNNNIEVQGTDGKEEESKDESKSENTEQS